MRSGLNLIQSCSAVILEHLTFIYNDVNIETKIFFLSVSVSVADSENILNSHNTSFYLL